MALVFTLTHVFSVVTASPEDWPSGPPFGHVEDPGVFTKAFINVTKEEEGEWKSQVDELGRLVVGAAREGRYWFHAIFFFSQQKSVFPETFVFWFRKLSSCLLS